MTHRLMLATCWLCGATVFLSQNPTIRISAVGVGLTLALYLTYVAIHDVRERTWTMAMFGLAIAVWVGTEWRASTSSAQLVGFWTFIVLGVAAIAPAVGRFYGTLIRMMLHALRVRAMLGMTPGDLRRAQEYLRSTNTRRKA